MKNVRKSLAAFAALVFAYSIQAGGSATFSPTTLPDATVGVSYSATVSVSSRDATITAGEVKSTLPDGISWSWDRSGKFYFMGTPTTAGTTKIYAAVTFSDGTQAMGEISLNVKPADGGGSTGGETGGGETGGGSSVTFTYSPDVSSVELGSNESQTFSVAASDSTATFFCYWWKGSGMAASSNPYTYRQRDTTPVTLKVEVYADREMKSKLDERSWTINPKTASAPSIANAYPTSPVEITTGEKETFGVAVVDADSGVSYKWYQNDGGAEGFQLISGQTRPTYEYTCTGANVQLKVEVWSSDGKTKHDEATWSVAAKAPIGNPKVNGFNPSTNTVEVAVNVDLPLSVVGENIESGVKIVWELDAGVGRFSEIYGVTGTNYTYRATSAGTNRVQVTVMSSDENEVYGSHVWTIAAIAGSGGSTGGETGGGETGGGSTGGGDEGGGEGGGTGGETIYITGKTPSSASVEMVTGAKQTFSVEINNPAASVRYAWYCGPRLGSTTVIPGATASSYEYQCTGEEVNLMVYVLPAEGSGVHEAFTWYITPKEPDPVPTVTGFTPNVASVNDTVGKRITFTASVANATSDITYEWEIDATGRGSFSPISGATGPSYMYYLSSVGTSYLRVTVKNGEGTMLDGGQKVWTITATESTTTMTLSRSSPASESVSMTVGSKQTFVATGSGLDGATLKWLVNGAQKGGGSLSYEFEPTAAGTYTIMCTAVGSSGSKSVSWTVTATAATPTTFERETPAAQNQSMSVGETMTFSVKANGSTSGVSYNWSASSGSGGSSPSVTPSGLSCSFTPDAVGTYYIIFSYGSGSQVYWMVTVTAATPSTTFERDTPAAQNQSMSVGETMTFSVKANGSTSGVSYNWSASSGSGGSTPRITPSGLSCSFTPDAAGTYYIIFSYGSGSQVYWMVTVSAGGGEGGGGEGGSTEPFVRKTPATESTQVAVDTTITFEVEAKDTASTYTLNWGILKDGQIVTFTAPDSTSCPYTFRSAGTYTVTFSYSGEKRGSIAWTVIVGGGGSGGGDTPSLSRADPTEESVTIKYMESQTFTVEAKGISNANYLWYVGTSNVGTGLSYTYRPDDPGTTTLICKAVSKSGGAVLATVSWTVTANEDGGSGAGTTDLFEMESPSAQSQSMTVGGKMTFSVKANGDTSNYNFSWDFTIEGERAATLTTNPANPLESEFAPTGNGTYYVIFTYSPKAGGDNKQVFWVVAVTGGSSGGGDVPGGGDEPGGGDGPGGDVVEKDYIPIPTPPDTQYVGKMFFHRASLSACAFSKQITRQNGDASIYKTFELRGVLPAGVTLSDTGVLAGTMDDDLDGELIVMDLISANHITNCVTLKLVKRILPDTAPYLGLAVPAEDAVDAYINIQKTFTVLAYDEEEATITYNWYLDGTQTAYHSNFYNLKDSDPSHEGAQHTVVCCATDGTTGETLLKTWTVTMRQPSFAFTTESLPNGSVGGTLGLSGLDYLLPYGTSVVALDLVDGELPPGLTPLSNGALTGVFRKGGSYTFTLRAVCSNGETDEREFTISVSGTDVATPATWTVGQGKDSGSGSGSGGKTEGGKGDSSGEVLPTIKAAFAHGATAGDTINVNAITFSQDDLGAYKYLAGINVCLKGDIVVPVGAIAPDMTAFTPDGGSYSFTLQDGITSEYDYYGTKVLIAKVGSGKSASDFTVSGATAPYFTGVPAIDADGWLFTRCACVRATQTTDRLNLPDDVNLRDVVFNGATFQRTVIVSSEGVLPGSITFGGTNTFGASFNLVNIKEVKTIVKSGAKLSFVGGELGNSKLSGIEFEAGSTLEFNPNSSGAFVLGTKMTLPANGKINLSLTAALEVGKTCTVMDRYVGDNDLTNVFNIIPASGDATAYRLYCGAENTLVLAAEETSDAGELNWEDDSENLSGATAGSAFSYSFKANGPIEVTTNPRTGAVVTNNLYNNFTYSLVNSAYTMSRDRLNTFDDTVGSQELLQGAYRAGASASATDTEIGFPFPCGTNYVSTVKVWCAGRIKVGDVVIALCDKGLLADVSSTFVHVYVERAADKFTVRYGRFASVTLTPNGKIRLAFGPDADLPSVADPQHPLCYMTYGSEMVDFTSAESYVGAKDVILTPSCPPGLTLSSGGTLSGCPLLTGAYQLKVKVTAQDSSMNTYAMTRTFNLAIAEGRLVEDAPVIGVTKEPAVGDDGYVHLQLGEEAEFEASVGDGQQLRWTLDGVVVSTTGAYKLTAPTTRPLNADNARIHRMVAEADDSAGRLGWSIRKVWYVVYNRKVYVNASATAGAGGDGAGGAGGVTTGGDGAGGITTGEGGGTSAADGLTPQAAFADFQEGMFKYLLNGDEVIVAPGTYSTPIDFGNNDAKVTISATGTAQDTILDLAGNTKGYTRCFRQGRYELDYGRSGSLEVIFKPVQSAVVSGLALRGGSIAEDSHTGTTFPDSSVNYYGVVGGGAFGGDIRNCIIADCHAKDYGGGAYGAVLTHCIVEDCSSAVGGGCANCELSYCTIVGNTATSAAGGVDGESEAYYSIIIGNTAAGKANEYAATTTPVKLTPQAPTMEGCFTSGDPLFCADYHLAVGSPASGKGAYPTPDATECLVFVEIDGGGVVEPNDPDGVRVEVGKSLAFTTSGGRNVTAIYVNGEAVESPANSWTLENVVVNTEVRFVFAPTTLLVGATREYKAVSSAIAAARSGDTISVDAGTYEERLDLSGFAGTLTIEAANPEAKPVIDAKGAGRCVTASLDSDSVVFKNIVFVNGRAAKVAAGDQPYAEWLADGLHDYSDADLLAYGFGGGVFGGRYESCVITNCTALGSKGGGAFAAELIGCEIACNVAGTKDSGVNLRDMCGGGVFGGLVKDCRVHDNSLVGYQNQVYCRYRGAGTFGAEVRNSFVWDNYINCGSVASAIPSETHVGTDGVTVHTVEKAPTPAQLENHKTPIPVDGESPTYASFEAAQAAAAKQVADIPTPVARAISNYDAYANLFEIRTVEDGKGGFVNEPALKESVLETIHEQAMDALTKDDSGEPRESFQVQKMEKTLTNTIPGLYYALEFSSDLSAGSFVGDRHLATGSGSVKLSATSLNTPSGFWRMAVYLTPDGE